MTPGMFTLLGALAGAAIGALIGGAVGDRYGFTVIRADDPPEDLDRPGGKA